ncbi:unnamed protein product [Amoebophrya sp. A25]|nr:unnamed protein product [Amoebophrya sp. A25]|eukprot:GSA25T00002021001.1
MSSSSSSSSGFDPATWSPDQIKLTSGVVGAGVSNFFGIPADKFRVLVAQDTGSTLSVGQHLKDTLRSPGAAFTGATARINMKIMATALNLYVPPDWRESNPFGCAFAVGFGFSPLLNVPRMFQLGKIAGDSYPQTFRNFFTSFGGLQKYAANTAMFAPGEGLRMMMCFGTKDFIMPRIGGKEDPRSVSIPVHCAKMSAIAGPVVALIETIFALTTETVSTIHAKNAAAATKKPFLELLRETITPSYTGRCFTSLCAKNILANTSLFWIMFMSDFYTNKSEILTKK